MRHEERAKKKHKNTGKRKMMMKKWTVHSYEKKITFSPLSASLSLSHTHSRILWTFSVSLVSTFDCFGMLRSCQLYVDVSRARTDELISVQVPSKKRPMSRPIERGRERDTQAKARWCERVRERERRKKRSRFNVWSMNSLTCKYHWESYIRTHSHLYSSENQWSDIASKERRRKRKKCRRFWAHMQCVFFPSLSLSLSLSCSLFILIRERID